MVIYDFEEESRSIMRWLWTKLKNKIRYTLNTFFQPQMVYGYKDQNGVYLSNTRVSNTAILEKDHLELEDNVFIGHFNLIDAMNHRVLIEEGCQITNFISILTHSSHQSIRLYGGDYRNYSDLVGYVQGCVELGAYTFVGPHSVIMPGTKIGKGSLIAAYSYVSGEFPEFSVIAGNPAKVVGDTRASDEAMLQRHPELKEYYTTWAKGGAV